MERYGKLDNRQEVAGQTACHRESSLVALTQPEKCLKATVARVVVTPFVSAGLTNRSDRRRGAWGQYHGGRRPSDDSFHSPAVIPPSALDKPSIMKHYHRRRTCSHTSPTLHDTGFVECRWWNDGWTVKTGPLTVVSLHDTNPWAGLEANLSGCPGRTLAERAALTGDG